MRAHVDTWEALGATDPYWAVESRDENRHGGWETDLPAFYATGVTQVERAISLLPDGWKAGAVLDFGAGAGRLSMALARTFGHVTSADISAEMLARLSSRAEAVGVSNITTVNTSSETIPTGHDVAISLITLQHFPSWSAIDRALRDIAAALRDGGYLVVDFPTRPHRLKSHLQLRLRTYQLLTTLGVSRARLIRHGLSGISMRWQSAERFTSKLEAAGISVERVIVARGTFFDQATYVARRMT